MLGVHTIIWLENGWVPDDLTNGHVDGIVAYVAPGRVVLPAACCLPRWLHPATSRPGPAAPPASCGPALPTPAHGVPAASLTAGPALPALPGE